MAVDVITIWNAALGLVGSRAAVQSRTEATRPAQHLNAIWELFSTAELEVFWWNFITKTRSLNLLSEDPPARWDYIYQWPNDCLAFRYIEDEDRVADDPIPFEIVRTAAGKRAIATDEVSANGVYSENVINPAVWSAQFSLGMAYRLAVSLAMTEIGSERDSIKLFRLYISEMEKAKVVSANEEQRDRERDAESIRARNS